MNSILSIDPSGTGTSGIFFIDGEQKEFLQVQNREWKGHYSYLKDLIKTKQPSLILFEDTNYIHSKTKDGLSLFRLLGAIEFLTGQKETANVTQVKELSKKLLSGAVKIPEIEYLSGRGKGWMFQRKRVSIHCLEAYLVYYLWKNKPFS